jgi:hypothetical protein
LVDIKTVDAEPDTDTVAAPDTEANEFIDGLAADDNEAVTVTLAMTAVIDGVTAGDDDTLREGVDRGR